MEINGELIGMCQEPHTKEKTVMIKLSKESDADSFFENNYGKNIILKSVADKRSLNANAYFHVLCRKIGQSMRPPLSEIRVKNVMLLRYGVAQTFEETGAFAKLNVPADVLWEDGGTNMYHFIPIKQEGDNITWCRLVICSRFYDSKQMSVLIEGTVEEAKQMGVEVLSDAEIERMVNAWHSKT